MATKIQMIEGRRVIGALTLFDMTPSFALLHAVIPQARSITHDWRFDKWYVDIGDAPAPELVD